MSDGPDFTAKEIEACVGALSNTVYAIEGYLSADEAELLYRLATEVPKGGVIVEIGSYRGKSTVCLGLGARWAGAFVWAIDPHEDYQVTNETHYGMENHAILLKNLLEFEVAETVRVVALPSMLITHVTRVMTQIDLLWVDGSHDYTAVSDDLNEWGYYTNGKIALHDTNGHFLGVNKALQEFLAKNKDWKIGETVDSITVLERVQ